MIENHTKESAVEYLDEKAADLEDENYHSEASMCWEIIPLVENLTEPTVFVLCIPDHGLTLIRVTL